MLARDIKMYSTLVKKYEVQSREIITNNFLCILKEITENVDTIWEVKLYLVNSEFAKKY